MSSNLTGEKTLNDNQHLENRTVKGFIFCRPELYCSRCVHNAACFKYFLAVKYFLGVREVVPAAAVRLAAALINTILKLLYRTNLPPSPSPRHRRQLHWFPAAACKTRIFPDRKYFFLATKSGHNDPANEFVPRALIFNACPYFSVRIILK